MTAPPGSPSAGPVSARSAGPAGALPSAVIDTHISTLIFLGDRVYKLRKPVRLGFLDFSDRAARQADCIREVELNRRLAPDVYLGVVDVLEEGRPVDHLVVMRRLAAERRLGELVRSGADVGPCIRELARTLAAFHARARRAPEIEQAGSPEAVLGTWEANFEELSPYVGRILDAATDSRIQALARQFVAGRGPLLRERIDHGHVCDGHGDLQADDIFCLADGPRVLDCLEFDERLRFGDVAADVAFLIMDLRRRGGVSAAEQLLTEYQEFSGAALPSSLLGHYCASRAYVRAKVACMRWAQGEVASEVDARQLHELSADYLSADEVRLVLVGGPPGSGKSTLAASLAQSIGAVVLRTDEVRQELYRPFTGGTAAGSTDWLYSTERKDEVYRSVLERAESALGLGQSVVVDATWSMESRRQAAREVAARAVARTVELRCAVAPSVADWRIRRRLQMGEDPSQATPAVARSLAAGSDPWPEAVVIDTSGPEATALEKAVAVLARGSGRQE